MLSWPFRSFEWDDEQKRCLPRDPIKGRLTQTLILNFLATHLFPIFTLESRYQVLREILLGLDWKQLHVVIKSMTFGIGRSEFCLQLIHPLTE